MRLGNSSCASIAGPIARQVERLELVRIGDDDRALRVADRDVLEAPLAAAGARASPRPSGGAAGEVLRGESRAAHVDAAGRRAGDRRADLARRRCWIEKLSRVGPAAAAQVEDRLARAVARQLGLRAVGVEDPQVGDVRRVARLRESSRTPSAPTPKCGSQSRRTRAGRQLERQLVALDDQVVVAERLPLLEAHRGREYRARVASSAAWAPRTPHSTKGCRNPLDQDIARACQRGGAWSAVHRPSGCACATRCRRPLIRCAWAATHRR